MANSGAKFDSEQASMSEEEAGPIDTSENPEPMNLNPEMDLDEPFQEQTEIKFDDTGQMVAPQPEEEEALVNVLKPSPEKEAKLKSKEELPEWFAPYADSQKKMAEYFEWQRQQQEQYQVQQKNYADSQQQAYFRSPEYITQVCELNQLDAEDPVHRKMVETELRAQHDKQAYEDRLAKLEESASQTRRNQTQNSAQERLSRDFEELAGQYDVSSEVVEAAKSQAMKLVKLGVDQGEAISESLQFVRMAAKEPSHAKRAPSKRQARIDQLNSAGPGRGARSHRKTEMSMAEADMLVSRGGFFPN